MNIKFILSAAAAALIAANATAQTAEYEFTTIKENPVTSIKNQYRSGTCWCFSALSFIESEILRTKGIETDLSEMFVVGKSYRDRAIKYVRLDGHLNFAAGSSFGDVLHVIDDYGIVPQVTKSCLCLSMNHIPPGSSVHGISQARILEYTAPAHLSINTPFNTLTEWK